jgi:beta-lactamase regulating signal transducer with metallopeptidase domain
MDAVLNWLWQGLVVAAALRVMLFALERVSANVRYAVCWAAALFVIALPVLPSLQSTPAVALPDAFRATQVDAIVSLPDAWWTSTIVILAAWTLWAGIQIVRFVSAIVAIRRARSRSRAFPLSAESVLPHWHRVRRQGRGATLVVSDSVTTAAVLGWGSPMIAVAPSLVETLEADEIDRILIHEWAHVQRRDDLVNILHVVVRIVAGWHPALRWIDRRLHVEREIACDEITVAITGSPKSYAECLVKLASLKGAPAALRTAPAVFTPSSLRARIVKIVSPSSSIAPAWARSLAAAIVAVLCLISVGVGGLDVVEATAFAMPMVLPSRVLVTTPDPVAPIAPATRSMDMTSERSPRPTLARALPVQRPTADQPVASSTPRTEPDVPRSTDAGNVVPAPPAVETGAGSIVGQPIPVVTAVPLERSDVKAKPPQSPWSAAAAGGTVLGRKSKDASIATAGFFSRFARRVAGSF